MKLESATIHHRVAGSFTIARGSRTVAEIVEVKLSADGLTGRGQCVPYLRYGETMEKVHAQIASVSSKVEAGIDRLGLQSLLPAGAARNALDSALWDLEAKRSGRRVWELAGRTIPARIPTAFTLSVDTPAAMKVKAAENGWRPILKLKLAGAGDHDRVAAVREGAPKARLIVDANEAWTPATYDALISDLASLGVEAVEQPFPAEHDDWLDGRQRPITVIADESCHDRASLPALKGRYDMVNIKLNKTGGLTEALALDEEARAAGLGVMIGCMLAGSRAMAPAMVLTGTASIVDLDGPLLLADDDDPPLMIDDGALLPPPPELWG